MNLYSVLDNNPIDIVLHALNGILETSILSQEETYNYEI
jgi:hypothetical protein